MAEEEKMKFLEKLIKNGVKIGNFIMDNHGTMNLTNQMEAENNEKTSVTEGPIGKEVMGRAIKAVQKMFWGQSSYAVIFCAMRDCYHHEDNATLFETEIDELSSDMDFDYPCPTNTISSCFYNNSYLKLSVDKWEENNVKQRSVLLLKSFKNAVEEELKKKKL